VTKSPRFRSTQCRLKKLEGFDARFVYVLKSKVLALSECLFNRGVIEVVTGGRAMRHNVQLEGAGRHFRGLGVTGDDQPITSAGRGDIRDTLKAERAVGLS
jgi:hypothetical protein